MAKKKSSVSINALEKFCNCGDDNAVQRTLKADDGVEISYEVKKRLSFEECARFVEEVVSECIVPSETMMIPVSKDFMIKKGLMTYYANFTMPTRMVKAFELVTASTEIIEDILSIIDNSQYCMILDSIAERMDFEKKKMLSVQEVKVDQLLKEVSGFMDKMASLFGNVDSEQMSRFIAKMSELSNLTNISSQDLAEAMASVVANKE